MDNNVKEWMDFAEADLGSAHYLFDNYYRKPYHIICYHAQQAAEKALKAVIVANGATGGLPKVHDLEFLLNQMKNYVSVSENLYDYADVLTPYGIVARYPGEVSMTEDKARMALKYADEIVAWADKEINKNVEIEK